MARVVFETTGYEGKVIEHLRGELNLSLWEFASKLKRSIPYLRTMERGKVNLTFPVFRDLMVTMKLSPWIFFYATEKRSNYQNVRLSNFPKNLINSKFASENDLRSCIGSAFCFLRENARLSKKDFAELMNVKPQKISRLEVDSGLLTFGTIQDACARFNLPLWYFFLIVDRMMRKDVVSLQLLSDAIPSIARFESLSEPVLEKIASRCTDH